MSAWRAPLPKPQLGDLIAITTAQGFAYAQFTHDIPLQGQLLRILPGLYATRPCRPDLLGATARTLRHRLSAARGAFEGLRRKWPSWGQFAVPARNRPFTALSLPGARTREPGPPPYWTLWDGQRRWRVYRLTDEQWDLPVDGRPHK